MRKYEIDETKSFVNFVLSLFECSLQSEHQFLACRKLVLDEFGNLQRSKRNTIMQEKNHYETDELAEQKN